MLPLTVAVKISAVGGTLLSSVDGAPMSSLMLTLLDVELEALIEALIFAALPPSRPALFR